MLCPVLSPPSPRVKFTLKRSQRRSTLQISKYPLPISLLSNHNIQSRAEPSTVFRWTFKGNYSTGSHLPTTEFWKRSNKQRGHGSDRRQKQFDLFEKCQTNVKKRFEETVLQCFSHKLLSFVFWKSFGRLLIPNYTPMGNMFNFAPELDDDAHKFNHPLQNVAREGKYNQNWAHLQIKPTRCSECKTTHISRTW